MEIKKLILLSELAKKLCINKSKLTLYAKMGLFIKEKEFGDIKTGFYNEKETMERYNFINKQKEKGKTLEEIKKMLNK
jgi:DNA-binding transcriptional MerR regulator